MLSIKFRTQILKIEKITKLLNWTLQTLEAIRIKLNHTELIFCMTEADNLNLEIIGRPVARSGFDRQI